MFRYILQRLFSGMLSLITLIVIISAILYISPVDPASLSFGQQMNEEMLEAKRKELMLDQPIYNQILSFLHDLSPISVYESDNPKLNDINGFAVLELPQKVLIKFPYFRRSFQTGDKVSTMIRNALPNTILLATISIILASILGMLLGILAALKRDTIWDNLIVGLSTLGYSVPSYVSAILLSLVFGYWLRDWTNLNMQGSLITLNDIGDEVLQLKNIILPAIALGVRPIAVITQITRNTMLDIISQPYILTAKAKGLNHFSVIKDHVLKNLMNPVITSISGWFASLLAGAFFVESIFNYYGMGLLTVNALVNYDIPVLLGCLVVIASIFIFINILLDWVYVLIDKRVKIN